MGAETQDTFPEDQWPELKARMEQDGPAAVVAFVEAVDEPKRERQLYAFARRAFSGRDWSGKDLDKHIELCRAGIACGLRQAEQETDPAERDRRIDFANIVSYNLAADLAACWPGDDLPREQRHFEAGLQAADDCLRWRRQLNKGPFPFAIAHWARGMHLISLGRDAVEDMRAALDHARRDAEAKGKSTEVAPDGSDFICLNAAYLGLAERLVGQESDRYGKACAALEAMQQDEERRDDASFCLSQVRVVEERYLAG